MLFAVVFVLDVGINFHAIPSRLLVNWTDYSESCCASGASYPVSSVAPSNRPYQVSHREGGSCRSVGLCITHLSKLCA